MGVEALTILWAAWTIVRLTSSCTGGARGLSMVWMAQVPAPGQAGWVQILPAPLLTSLARACCVYQSSPYCWFALRRQLRRGGCPPDKRRDPIRPRMGTPAT